MIRVVMTVLDIVLGLAWIVSAPGMLVIMGANRLKDAAWRHHEKLQRDRLPSALAGMRR